MFVRRLFVQALGTIVSDRPVILGYHRVLPDRQSVLESGSPELAVTQDQFAEQVAYLKQYRRIVPLEHMVRALRENRLDSRDVALTFDDGYRDNLQYALPILERFEVPATLFVCTGLISRTAVPWWLQFDEQVLRRIFDKIPYPAQEEDRKKFPEWRRLRVIEFLKQQPLHAVRELMSGARAAPDVFMSWEEVALLSKHPLIQLGNHTHDHPSLAAETSETLRHNIEAAQDLLRTRTQRIPAVLSYPFGGRLQAGPREFECAAALGFSGAVTTVPGFVDITTNPWALPRVLIGSGYSLAELRLGISNFSSYLG